MFLKKALIFFLLLPFSIQANKDLSKSISSLALKEVTASLRIGTQVLWYSEVSALLLQNATYRNLRFQH